MKKDIYVDFLKNFMLNEIIRSDEFFPNSTVEKAHNYKYNDYQTMYRQISNDEEKVIEANAFNLLLFWVKSDHISKDFFENFLSILVSYSDKIIKKIDTDTLISMIEMISVVDFQEYIIYTAIELYIESPESLKIEAKIK